MSGATTISMGSNAETATQVSDLTQAASRGVLWSGINMAARTLVRFLTTAILARQLMPTDFGVIALAFLVEEIVRLVGGLNMSAAVIQRKEVDDRCLNTMFWTNVGVGIFSAALLCALAPLAADFFQNATVRPVCMWLSVNFILVAMGGVPRAILTRKLSFKTFAKINVSATVVRSIVALTCVFSGWGLWSIVAGMISERLVSVSTVWILVRWLPRYQFDRQRFTELFRFSRNLYGENVLHFFNRRSDYLLTGKLIGPAALGFYQFAQGIPHMVLTHFSQVLTEVLFPVYCKVQDDHERFRRGYLKTVTFISLITFPLMFGLMVVAPEFIRVVYGDRWLPVVLPMQILCGLAMVKSIFHTMGLLFKSKGRPEIGFKWNLAMLPVTITALVIAAPWGLQGIAIAVTVVGLFSIIPMRIATRLIDLRLRDMLGALVPAFGAALLMALVLLGVKQLAVVWFTAWPPAAALLTLAGLGAAVYVTVVRLVWPETCSEFVGFAKGMFERGVHRG